MNEVPDACFAADPLSLLRPKRRIVGMVAVLLPFQHSGEIDWRSFENLVAKTADAGLIPAVNMDTGFAHLIDDHTRRRVLESTRNVMVDRMFVAGAGAGGNDQFDLPAYQRQCAAIQSANGLPVVIQSAGLVNQPDDAIIKCYQRIATECEKFIAFELSTQFAPFGKIYSMDVYRELIRIPQCIGAKHSSLRRQPEWQRIAARNELRPDFMVLTGNDLAIDMVMYGSDYLLGLGCFAPDLFARRDALWELGDPAFYELNDALQDLGNFAFRAPVPAYKHSAAQFLHLRGWIATDRTHSQSPTRSAADVEILRGIMARLEIAESTRV